MEDFNSKFNISVDKSYKDLDAKFDFKIISLNDEEKERIGKEKINIVIMKYKDRSSQEREFIIGEFNDEKLKDLSMKGIFSSINSQFRIYNKEEKAEAEVKDEINTSIDMLVGSLEDKLDIKYTKEGYDFVYGNKESIIYDGKASVIINEDEEKNANLSFYSDSSSEKIFASKKEREQLRAEFYSKLREQCNTIEEMSQNMGNDVEDFLDKLTGTEKQYLEKAFRARSDKNLTGNRLKVVENVLNGYISALYKKYMYSKEGENPINPGIVI